MINFGKVKPGSTLYIPFSTFGTNGEALTMSGFAVTDIEIYKDGSTTQRSSDNGYTLLDTDGIDFDGVTGIHGFSVNLADNSDAGFYAAGSKYFIHVASITVNTQTVNFIAATFEIEIPNAIHSTTIATLASQTSFTLTAGPAEDDALNGCVAYIHDVASAVQGGYAVVNDYTGATKTVTLAAGTTFTAAATDNIGFFPPANVAYFGGSAGTFAGGRAEVNTTHFGGAALTQSGGRPEVNTTHAAGTAWGSGAITAASIASGAITSAKFAAGAIDATAIATGAIDADALAADAITSAKIADNTITAAKINSGAITAAKFAAGAIDAAALAADAVTEIQSGLATSAALATAQTDLDTITGANGVIIASGTQTFNMTGNITGNLSGSVGSVTGAVGSVTGNVGGNVAGSVGSVTGAVGSVTGNVGGNVAGSVGSVTAEVTPTAASKTGYRLSATGVGDILTTALTESYAADGAAPTLSQAIFAIQQMMQERAISTTTMTIKKLDGSTTAMTFTLDDASSPTSITRAS